MNRHERRAYKARGRAIMSVTCRPFEPPAPFSEMPKDARRMYVAILCSIAEKIRAGREDQPPVWRMAASFHELIQKCLIGLEFDGNNYKIVFAPDFQFNWIN
jgi:hypothetical protein